MAKKTYAGSRLAIGSGAAGLTLLAAGWFYTHPAAASTVPASADSTSTATATATTAKAPAVVAKAKKTRGS